MKNSNLNADFLGNADMSITPEIKLFLKETAKWAKFLSIVGFVMIGLFVILAVFMSIFMGSMLSTMPEAGLMGAMGGGIFGFIYIVMAIIYFFPVLYMYRFATKMKIALNTNDQNFLTTSFENLKSCYKFMGIFIAIFLAFYALGFILIFVLGGLGRFFG